MHSSDQCQGRGNKLMLMTPVVDQRDVKLLKWGSSLTVNGKLWRFLHQVIIFVCNLISISHKELSMCDFQYFLKSGLKSFSGNSFLWTADLQDRQADGGAWDCSYPKVLLKNLSLQCFQVMMELEFMGMLVTKKYRVAGLQLSTSYLLYAVR